MLRSPNCHAQPSRHLSSQTKRGVVTSAAKTKAPQSKERIGQTAPAPADDAQAPLLVAAEIPGRRAEDGTPVVRLVPVDQVVAAVPHESAWDDAVLLRGVHQTAQSRPAGAAVRGAVQVPGNRVLHDPAELDLIGSGLPIIRGVRMGAA